MNATEHGSPGRPSWRRAPLAVFAIAIAIGLGACSSSASSPGSASSASGSPAGTGTAGSPAASGGSGATPAALASFLPGTVASGAAVKIGLINNEGSSPTAQSATGDAAVAAADYANAELGGIGGHPIQVVRCAEEEDSASATACANEMVADNVDAVVIGATGFGQTMVPIITRAGIPYVTTIGSAAAELTTPGAFSFVGGFFSALAAMAKYSAQQGYKQVTAYVIEAPAAILGAKSVGAPVFKAAHVGYSVTPVTAGVADATSQIVSGLAGKPDAVALVADAGTCESMLKALNVVNPGIPKMVINSCLDSAVLAAVGSGMNGVKEFGFSSTQTNDPEAQLYRYVMAKYYPSADTSGYTVTGYQSMLGLVRATAGLSGAVTPASITAAIKAAKDVPLPAGDGLTFTCDGKQIPGLSSACSPGMVVLTITNGQGLDPQLIG